MKVEVRLPCMGEDAEDAATVAFWSVDTGDTVSAEDDLIEMTTDKAAFTVPSPETGVLVEKCGEEGDEVKAGDLLGIIEV